MVLHRPDRKNRRGSKKSSEHRPSMGEIFETKQLIFANKSVVQI